MARPGKPTEDEFLHALYQGGELLAAGKVIEAKEHLERAFKLQPKNEKAQNLLGLTYFKLGLFDRAAEIYENLVQENPADPTLRVNLGLVYLKTTAIARAIREFETATDLNPEHMRAHNYLGIALAQVGEYGRAREHFITAGSDQMAEKMARAIAGDGAGLQGQAQGPAQVQAETAAAVLPSYSAPPVVPAAPAAPAPAPSAAQMNEADEVAAAYGLPAQVNGTEHPFVSRAEAAPKRAAAASSPLPPPAVSPPPPPAAALEEPVASAPMTASAAVGAEVGALQAQDWGAHFGLDGTTPADPGGRGGEEIAVSTPESADAGAIALQRAAGREGAAEDQFEASFVEPAESGERDGSGGAPESSAGELAVEEMPPVEGVETPADEVLQIEVMAPEAESQAAVVEQPPMAEAPETHAEEIVADAVVDAVVEVEPRERPPNFAEVQPPGSRTGKPLRPLEVNRGEGGKARPVPVDLPIAELAPKVAMFSGQKPGPFLIDSEAVAIVVQGEILTRVVGLVAQSGQLEMTPQNRRFRGRTSDQTFGDGEAQMMRVEGKGRLVVQVPRRTLVSVDLDDESAYFLEGTVFGFEEPVAFENGRVPSDVAPDLDLVHLRGKGKVLLSLPGALRSLEVTEHDPVTVPLTNVVGWHGNLSPRVVPLARDKSGKAIRAGIELSGEGFALLSMGGS